MRRSWVGTRLIGLLVSGLVCAACGGGSSSAKPPVPTSFGLLSTIQLPNLNGKPAILTSFDISWFDNFKGGENVYFTDSGNNALDQVNTANNTFVQYINAGGFGGANSFMNFDCNGPNGVITAIGPNDSFHEAWVGDISGATKTNCDTATPKPVLWAFDLTKNPPVPVTFPNNIANPIDVSCGVGGLTPISGDPTSPTLNPPACPTPGIAPLDRADELSYDSKDDLILIATPHPAPGLYNANTNPAGCATSLGQNCGPYVSIVQAGTGQVLGQIVFPQADGGLEQSQWYAANDTFYLNLPSDTDLGKDANGNEIGGVAQIQINSVNPLKVTVTVPTSATAPFSQVVSCGATGMAIESDGDLFLGCPNTLTPNNAFPAPFPKTPGPAANFAEVMNIGTGQIVAAPFGNLSAADEVWFDSFNGLNTESGLNGVLSFIDEATNEIGASFLASPGIPSPPPHSITADSVNGHIIVPGPANSETWDNSASLTVLPGSTQPGDFTCTKGCVWVFGPSPNNSYPVE
jgi:hypothetical protein